MLWFRLHNYATGDNLGFIPEFFDATDERPVAEQIADSYCGGWSPQQGFVLPEDARRENPASLALLFSGDPPLLPLFCTVCNDELVVVYDYGYTAIFQPDLTFEASRLD